MVVWFDWPISETLNLLPSKKKSFVLFCFFKFLGSSSLQISFCRSREIGREKPPSSFGNYFCSNDATNDLHLYSASILRHNWKLILRDVLFLTLKSTQLYRCMFSLDSGDVGVQEISWFYFHTPWSFGPELTLSFICQLVSKAPIAFEFEEQLHEKRALIGFSAGSCLV